MSGRVNITVLGAGAWGTALGCAMVRAGHSVTIWGRDKQIIEEICTDRRNRHYLGDTPLVARLQATMDLYKAVSEARIILLVTPAQTVSMIVNELKGLLDQRQIVISCAKGIDRKTHKTPTALIAKLVEPEYIGVLSGPSFAHDVVRDLPTAVTIAFQQIERAKEYAFLLSSKNFRIYASDDLTGVELGGALKNVLALAVGMARGMRLGASAEAALVARGFKELRQLAEKMGARPETLSGLSGLGDFILTASSEQSRNFSYGMALGCGDTVDHLPLAEGVLTAQTADKLARDNGVDAPIIQSVSGVLAGRMTASEAVCQLLSRPLKAENE